MTETESESAALRDARIDELESLLAEAYADADDVLRPRIAELERELAEARTLLAIAANYLQEHWDMESVPLRDIQAAAIAAAEGEK